MKYILTEVLRPNILQNSERKTVSGVDQIYSNMEMLTK